MTKKRPSARQGAVWCRYQRLRPDLAAGNVPTEAERIKAAIEAADQAGARILGQFVLSGRAEEFVMSEDAWTELLDFLGERRAGVLIARPELIAHTIPEYTRRQAQLMERSVQWIPLTDTATSADEGVGDAA